MTDHTTKEAGVDILSTRLVSAIQARDEALSLFRIWRLFAFIFAVVAVVLGFVSYPRETGWILATAVGTALTINSCQFIAGIRSHTHVTRRHE